MSEKSSKHTLSRTERIANRINALSRPSRMAINIWISLMTMGVVGLPLVFLFGGQNKASTIPIVAVATVWLVVYAAGWYALIGFDLDEERPWQAGKPAVWIVVIGIIMTFLVALELIFGLLFGLVL